MLMNYVHCFISDKRVSLLRISTDSETFLRADSIKKTSFERARKTECNGLVLACECSSFSSFLIKSSSLSSFFLKISSFSSFFLLMLQSSAFVTSNLIEIHEPYHTVFFIHTFSVSVRFCSMKTQKLTSIS